MSHKLSGYQAKATSTAVVPSTEAPPRNALAEIKHPRAAVDVNIHNDPLSNPAIGHNNPGFLSGAVKPRSNGTANGLFSGVTFNNSPVNSQHKLTSKP